MDSRQMGLYGELVAARYLRRKKYTILETNFHSRYGEIDIVAKQKDTVVFVEVKTRDISSSSRPMEAVSASKQQKIKSTALVYLGSRYDTEVNVRFDVIEVLAVTTGKKEMKINHIIDAFE
ncbi:MAG: YraN family protein [Clostridia bacterium]|nr:YraN family protein [Clostridia bacterium]